MGPLMLDVSACEINADEKEILDHPLVGGVILFSRNYHDQAQLTELVRQIREYSRNQVLIAVDQEGGQVQRFKQGFSPIPAMGRIYNKASSDMELACPNAEMLGWLMAAEILAFDIDISFAPVLDIWGVSDVIGDRSFHPKEGIIIELASRFIRGMHQAGMKSCGKHFPGHGNVKEDSHVTTPVDKRSAEQIMTSDMRIFAEIHQQGLLDAVMPAHVVYPAVDKLPAGYSSKWIREILRKKLDFDGVVFSDDLSMQGATSVGNFAQRAKAAMQAGCDMVLVCNDRAGAIQVLDGLPIDYQASDRLKTMQKGPSPDMGQLQLSPRWQQAQQLIAKFN
ncbi:beta-N-acetylhexosaminidase [Neptunicella sp. SCSIO 80796]|uniref:beta-N-acetylhexosaminidase n=1 Tax=Neptunicella plasticusilytica TaxID=3117012 RepID=UPI003A4E413D